MQMAPFVLFPLFFLVVWRFVAFAISRVGGWAALAQRYRFTGEFFGTQWNW